MGSRNRITSTKSTATKSTNIPSKKNDGQNAPWMCTGCEEALDNDGGEVIECHSCKQWCHRACSDLTDAQFKCLRGGGNYMVWLCKICREVQRSEVAIRMETKLDNVLKMLESLKSRIDDMESKHDACSDENIDKKIEQKVGEYMEEMQEREKRKLNIIVVNLPESGKDSAEERKQEDRDRVRQLVSRTVDDVDSTELDNPIRLGPIKIGQNARPRLLRMTVQNVETKKKILKNVAKLNRNVPFEKRVFINDDSTPKERERIKELRAEMQVRKENGEQNLMINYREGKIMTRPEGHGSQKAAAAQASTAQGESADSSKH